MYARGMTTREIQAHLQEIYGVDVSPTLISNVTEAVQDEVRAWQNRPLEPLYPIVYMDALYVRIRDTALFRHHSVVQKSNPAGHHCLTIKLRNKTLSIPDRVTGNDVC